MNESTKRLEADDFESSEELCTRYPTEYRRNKIDISSGFTDLKAGKRDSYVRDFIDKLKEKREASRNNSLNENDEKLENEK